MARKANPSESHEPTCFVEHERRYGSVAAGRMLKEIGMVMAQLGIDTLEKAQAFERLVARDVILRTALEEAAAEGEEVTLNGSHN